MKHPATILAHARCFLDGRFETCSLKIADGLIQEVAGEISSSRGDTVLDLEGTAILPGLINSHDHLEFNLFDKIGSPPYPNYVAWGEHIHLQHRDYIQQVLRVPLRHRLLWGAYKNIFSGVTTVVHHNEYYARFRFRYPVEVLRNYSWIHSLSLDKKLKQKLSRRNGDPCIVHLSEGVDDLAAVELATLHELGGLTSNTVIVHGIGLSTHDIALIERAGASLVWCPSSNEFLFHRTAPIENALDKIRIALGTDSTLTGNSSLFEEIRLAVQLKRLDPSRVLTMVTSTPGAIFRLQGGAIEPGRPADLLLFECPGDDPMAEFLTLHAGKIQCLIRNGIPLYGDRVTVQALGVSSAPHTAIEVMNKKKTIRGDLSRLVQVITRILPSFDFNGLPIQLETTH